MNEYKGLKMDLDLIGKKRLIFSELFILQNKIQTRFDKLFDDISSKQLIILVIVKSFPNPPSLTEVAKHAGCSRQNVKKIATVLEKKGYVTFVSEKGTRAVCIQLKQKFYDFYEEFMRTSGQGIEVLFEGMNEKQIDDLFYGLHMVEKNVDRFLTIENATQE